jgi:lambda repressor-like predicted transcriptional regulator
MNPKLIKRRLEDKGISQKSISEELEVSQSLVSSVISGTTTSIRVADHIAQKLGKPAGMIWPKKYQSTINNESAAN